MSDAITNAELATMINVGGIGYTVEARPDMAARMGDPETARLWRDVASAIDRLEDHLDPWLRSGGDAE